MYDRVSDCNETKRRIRISRCTVIPASFFWNQEQEQMNEQLLAVQKKNFKINMQRGVVILRFLLLQSKNL